MKSIYTFNHNPAIYTQLDNRAHLLQELNEVNNFRLISCIFDNRYALCQRGREQKILCCHHAGEGKRDGRTMQALAGRTPILTISLFNKSPHLTEASEMKIYGARTDAVATWGGQRHLATAMKHRSNQQDGDTIKLANFT